MEKAFNNNGVKGIYVSHSTAARLKDMPDITLHSMMRRGLQESEIIEELNKIEALQAEHADRQKVASTMTELLFDHSELGERARDAFWSEGIIKEESTFLVNDLGDDKNKLQIEVNHLRSVADSRLAANKTLKEQNDTLTERGRRMARDNERYQKSIRARYDTNVENQSTIKYLRDLAHKQKLEIKSREAHATDVAKALKHTIADLGTLHERLQISERTVKELRGSANSASRNYQLAREVEELNKKLTEAHYPDEEKDRLIKGLKFSIEAMAEEMETNVKTAKEKEEEMLCLLESYREVISDQGKTAPGTAKLAEPDKDWFQIAASRMAEEGYTLLPRHQVKKIFYYLAGGGLVADFASENLFNLECLKELREIFRELKMLT
ncbi:hypothetical protein KAR91_83740 [Candidatus Pacearchaeota archaeon]|nr:hypothetical protein [Candidatus Pacearchaeota archaeon]